MTHTYNPDPRGEVIYVGGHAMSRADLEGHASAATDDRFAAARMAREIENQQRQELPSRGVGGHQASQQLLASRGYGSGNSNSGWTGNFQPGEIDQSALYVERQPDPVSQEQLDRFQQLRDMLPGRLG